MAGTGTAHLRNSDDVLLRVEDLVVEFPVGRTGLKVHAVSSISLDIREGETLGLVGESGCGKSTTGKAIMQLPRPSAGHVVFEGQDLTGLTGEDLRRTRTRMKMIFQDPISSLNPRRKVEDIIAEGLRIWHWTPDAGFEAAKAPTPPVLRIAAVLSFVAMVASAALALVWIFGGPAIASIGVDAAFYVVGGFVAAGAAFLWYSTAKGLLRASASYRRIGIAMWSIYLAGGLIAVLVGSLLGLVAVVLAVVGLAVLLSPPARAAVSTGDAAIDDRVDEMMLAVGLDPALQRGKRPHQFSGGQCQRISIARAVVTDPKLIICDEPVSALDVSVQAQILNLLEDMKARYGLTLVFIAHDLAVVKNVSDRVVVMYLGKICEVGPPDLMYKQPAHPYTAALLSAIPVPDPSVRPDERPSLGGEIPSPVAPPSGCRFRTRCPKAQERCAAEEPQVREIGAEQYVACHFPLAPGESLPSTNGSTPV